MRVQRSVQRRPRGSSQRGQSVEGSAMTAKEKCSMKEGVVSQGNLPNED